MDRIREEDLPKISQILAFIDFRLSQIRVTEVEELKLKKFKETVTNGMDKLDTLSKTIKNHINKCRNSIDQVRLFELCFWFQRIDHDRKLLISGQIRKLLIAQQQARERAKEAGERAAVTMAAAAVAEAHRHEEVILGYEDREKGRAFATRTIANLL